MALVGSFHRFLNKTSSSPPSTPAPSGIYLAPEGSFVSGPG
jgi:hypothetical protein